MTTPPMYTHQELCESTDDFEDYTFLPLKKGMLPFMLTFQSLDGRFEIEYHHNIERLVDRVAYLRSLGRAVKVWGDLSGHIDYAVSDVMKRDEWQNISAYEVDTSINTYDSGTHNT